MIPEIQKFREQYPEYGDMTDIALAKALANRYPEYSDLTEKVGLESAATAKAKFPALDEPTPKPATAAFRSLVTPTERGELFPSAIPPLTPAQAAKVKPIVRPEMAAQLRPETIEQARQGFQLQEDTKTATPLGGAAQPTGPTMAAAFSAPTAMDGKVWPYRAEDVQTLPAPTSIANFVKINLGPQAWKNSANLIARTIMSPLAVVADYEELSGRAMYGHGEKLTQEEEKRLSVYNTVGWGAVLAASVKEGLPAAKGLLDTIKRLPEEVRFAMKFKPEQIKPEQVLRVLQKIDRGDPLGSWEQSVYDDIVKFEPYIMRDAYTRGDLPLLRYVERKQAAGLPAIPGQVVQPPPMNTIPGAEIASQALNPMPVQKVGALTPMPSVGLRPTMPTPPGVIPMGVVAPKPPVQQPAPIPAQPAPAQPLPIQAAPVAPGAPIARPVVSPPQAVKEPWEMTREEISTEIAKGRIVPVDKIGFGPDIVKRTHKNIVQQALAEGKPVPQEVLADYPDLAQAAPVIKRGQKYTTPAGEIVTATGQSSTEGLAEVLRLEKGVGKPAMIDPAELTPYKKPPKVKVAPPETESRVVVTSETKPETIRQKLQKRVLLPNKAQNLAELRAALPGAVSAEKSKDKAREAVMRKYEIKDGDSAEVKVEKNKKMEAELAQIKKSNPVSIKVDGIWKIENTPEAINKVISIIEHPTAEPKGWSTQAPKKTFTPVAGRKEDIGPLVEVKGGKYFTDTRLAVKGQPPAKAKFAEGKQPVSEEDIKKTLQAKTAPAELEFYFVYNPSPAEGLHTIGDEESGPVGISDAPIGGEGKLESPWAVFKTPDGKHVFYNQNRFNVLRNRYPNAKYGIVGKNGLLVAYDGKEPVAALMPLDFGDRQETVDKIVAEYAQTPSSKTTKPAPKVGEAEAAPVSKPKKTVKPVSEKQIEKAIAEDETLMRLEESRRYAGSAQERQGIEEEIEVRKGEITANLTGKRITSYSAGSGGSGGRIVSEPEGGGGRPKPAVPFKEQQVEFAKTGGRGLGGLFQEHLGPELRTAKLKVYDGLFKYPPTPNGRIKVRTLEHLRTLAHEIGHFVDLVLGKYPIEKRGPVRNELIALTKTLSPFEERYIEWVDEKGKPHRRMEADSYVRYRRSREELFADFISAYATNPELARKVAPLFTAEIDREIAAGTEAGKNIEELVNKLKQWSDEFNPLADYVAALREIPEIRPEIEESFERGNPLQLWYRRSIGDKVWDLVSKGFDKIGKKPIAKEFFEKAGVSDAVFHAMRERLRLIHGQQARLKEVLIEPIRALDEDDKFFVSQSLQRFDQNAEDTPVNKLTEEARRELALWGNEARKLGLLNDEVFWNNVGQYYPYFYTSKEFNDMQAKFPVASKAVRINLKSFKHRMTDEEMVFEGLKAKYGTWPSQLKKAEEELGSMTPEEIKARAYEIRQEMGLIEKNPEYSLYKRMASLIQSVYTTKALNHMAGIPGVVGKKGQDGYVKMPESVSLGALSGQWIEKNTADVINSWNAQSGEFMKVLETINSVWKALKVPYNPSAMARNIVSNFMLQWMVGDVPVWNPTYAARGVNSFIKKDDAYELLRDNGLYKQTYAANELEVLAGKEGSMSGVIEWAVETFNKPGELYGAIEDIGKTIIARYVMDHGGTVGQAVDLATKCLFDYSSTSAVTSALRKFPIPFITFSAKVLPRMVEAAIRKPEKYALFFLMLAAASAYARQRLNASKERVDAALPEYLEGHPYILLPWRDKNGEFQFIDLSYFVPWGGWTERRGVLPQPLLIGNPFVMFYNAYVQNYDAFTGREIAPDYFTEAEKRAAKGRYMRQGALPDLFGGRASERLVRVFRSEPDYYGRETDWKKEVLRDLTGVNIALGGEKTTGPAKWKKQRDRDRIERRRPAKLATIEALKNPTERNKAKARELLSRLDRQERKQVYAQARQEYKRLIGGQAGLDRLSKKDRRLYRKFIEEE
jgi:hypothetical protein